MIIYSSERTQLILDNCFNLWLTFSIIKHNQGNDHWLFFLHFNPWQFVSFFYNCVYSNILSSIESPFCWIIFRSKYSNEKREKEKVDVLSPSRSVAHSIARIEEFLSLSLIIIVGRAFFLLAPLRKRTRTREEYIFTRAHFKIIISILGVNVCICS